MNTFWNTQANLPLISLITLEVLAQTLQNQTLQNYVQNWQSKWITFEILKQIYHPMVPEKVAITIRWCLQNYMEDDWELLFEMTSK